MGRPHSRFFVPSLRRCPAGPKSTASVTPVYVGGSHPPPRRQGAYAAPPSFRARLAPLSFRARGAQPRNLRRSNPRTRPTLWSSPLGSREPSLTRTNVLYLGMDLARRKATPAPPKPVRPLFASVHSLPVSVNLLSTSRPRPTPGVTPAKYERSKMRQKEPGSKKTPSPRHLLPLPHNHTTRHARERRPLRNHNHVGVLTLYGGSDSIRQAPQYARTAFRDRAGC